MKIKEYIMQELDNGRTIDEIAAEFTDSLNEAKDRTAQEARRRELEIKLAETFNEYMRLFPALNIGNELNAEEIHNVFEEVFDVFKPLIMQNNTYATLDTSKLHKEKESKVDPIADFLKSLGC